MYQLQHYEQPEDVRIKVAELDERVRSITVSLLRH